MVMIVLTIKFGTKRLGLIPSTTSTAVSSLSSQIVPNSGGLETEVVMMVDGGKMSGKLTILL